MKFKAYDNPPSRWPDRNQIINLLHKMHSLDHQQRDAALLELRAFKTEPLFDILSALLLPDSDKRYSAAEAVLRLDTERGIELVLPLLEDPDSGVRYEVCGLLSAFGDERAIEPLTRTMMQDADGTIRHVAAFALGKIGDARALPALKWTQEHDLGTDFEGRPISEMAAESIEAIRARLKANHE